MIRVAISSDSSGFASNATLIASILRRTESCVHIRCWCRGFLPESFEQGRLKVEFLPAAEEVTGRYPGRSGPAAYDRLLVIRDCLDWDRCLVMDYDQVAFCDLAPLFEMELGDHLLAAHMQGEGVDMDYAMRVWVNRAIPDGWEHVAKHPYFLMPPLLNLAEMRKAGTWEKFLAAHAAFGMDEQLSLTAATEGRTLPLAAKWNMFPGLHISGDDVPDGIVHWCGWPKPWHNGAMAWRPELWEAERCSWEHLRMGLWDKPVAVEVEPDDDHGVEELLKRGWMVRLFTGWEGSTDEELPGFRYPDLVVETLDKVFREELQPRQPSSSFIPPETERVRFGSGVRAAELLAGCEALPEHVVLRGPQPAEEVGRVVALGYGLACTLRHHEWAAGGPMARALAYSPLEEIRSLDATEEWYLKRGGVAGCIPIVATAGEMDGGRESKLAAERVHSVKAAVLVAAVGKDRRHLRFFLEGLQQRFLPGVEKRVFVFTDGGPVAGEDVTSIPVTTAGFGMADLERYGWLLRAEPEFKDCDLLFVFKPQVRLTEPIEWAEIACEGLSASLHSAYEGQARHEIRFEENEASVAWVGPREGRQYVCGSWQGGTRERFFEAVRTITDWIGQDRTAGVMPQWGDESYWNRYFLDVPPDRLLGAEYAWRTGTKLPRNGLPKVLVLPAGEGKPTETKPVRRAARKGIRA